MPKHSKYQSFCSSQKYMSHPPPSQGINEYNEETESLLYQQTPLHKCTAFLALIFLMVILIVSSVLFSNSNNDEEKLVSLTNILLCCHTLLLILLYLFGNNIKCCQIYPFRYPSLYYIILIFCLVVSVVSLKANNFLLVWSIVWVLVWLLCLVHHKIKIKT